MTMPVDAGSTSGRANWTPRRRRLRSLTRLNGTVLLAQGDEIRIGNAVIGYRLVMPRDTTIE
jgi:hypothetical protein